MNFTLTFINWLTIKNVNQNHCVQPNVCWHSKTFFFRLKPLFSCLFCSRKKLWEHGGYCLQLKSAVNKLEPDSLPFSTNFERQLNIVVSFWILSKNEIHSLGRVLFIHIIWLGTTYHSIVISKRFFLVSHLD